ncbi:unnamed protein product [Amoebophrya sp. A120]|nr:unnamed protein product [Amoebophrya sp. A120]|eukprot:GSA120T00008055001.1
MVKFDLDGVKAFSSARSENCWRMYVDNVRSLSCTTTTAIALNFQKASNMRIMPSSSLPIRHVLAFLLHVFLFFANDGGKRTQTIVVAYSPRTKRGNLRGLSAPAPEQTASDDNYGYFDRPNFSKNSYASSTPPDETNGAAPSTSYEDYYLIGGQGDNQENVNDQYNHHDAGRPGGAREDVGPPPSSASAGLPRLLPQQASFLDIAEEQTMLLERKLAEEHRREEATKWSLDELKKAKHERELLELDAEMKKEQLQDKQFAQSSMDEVRLIQLQEQAMEREFESKLREQERGVREDSSHLESQKAAKSKKVGGKSMFIELEQEENQNRQVEQEQETQQLARESEQLEQERIELEQEKKQLLEEKQRLARERRLELQAEEDVKIARRRRQEHREKVSNNPPKFAPRYDPGYYTQAHGHASETSTPQTAAQRGRGRGQPQLPAPRQGAASSTAAPATRTSLPLFSTSPDGRGPPLPLADIGAPRVLPEERDEEGAFTDSVADRSASLQEPAPFLFSPDVSREQQLELQEPAGGDPLLGETAGHGNGGAGSAGTPAAASGANSALSSRPDETSHEGPMADDLPQRTLRQGEVTSTAAGSTPSSEEVDVDKNFMMTSTPTPTGPPTDTTTSGNKEVDFTSLQRQTTTSTPSPVTPLPLSQPQKSTPTGGSKQETSSDRPTTKSGGAHTNQKKKKKPMTTEEHVAMINDAFKDIYELDEQRQKEKENKAIDEQIRKLKAQLDVLEAQELQSIPRESRKTPPDAMKIKAQLEEEERLQGTPGFKYIVKDPAWTERNYLVRNKTALREHLPLVLRRIQQRSIMDEENAMTMSTLLMKEGFQKDGVTLVIVLLISLTVLFGLIFGPCLLVFGSARFRGTRMTAGNLPALVAADEDPSRSRFLAEFERVGTINSTVLIKSKTTKRFQLWSVCSVLIGCGLLFAEYPNRIYSPWIPTADYGNVFLIPGIMPINEQILRGLWYLLPAVGFLFSGLVPIAVFAAVSVKSSAPAQDLDGDFVDAERGNRERQASGAAGTSTKRQRSVARRSPGAASHHLPSALQSGGAAASDSGSDFYNDERGGGIISSTTPVEEYNDGGDQIDDEPHSSSGNENDLGSAPPSSDEMPGSDGSGGGHSMDLVSRPGIPSSANVSPDDVEKQYLQEHEHHPGATASKQKAGSAGENKAVEGQHAMAPQGTTEMEQPAGKPDADNPVTGYNPEDSEETNYRSGGGDGDPDDDAGARNRSAKPSSYFPVSNLQLLLLAQKLAAPYSLLIMLIFETVQLFYGECVTILAYENDDLDGEPGSPPPTFSFHSSMFNVDACKDHGQHILTLHTNNGFQIQQVRTVAVLLAWVVFVMFVFGAQVALCWFGYLFKTRLGRDSNVSNGGVAVVGAARTLTMPRTARISFVLEVLLYFLIFSLPLLQCLQHIRSLAFSTDPTASRDMLQMLRRTAFDHADETNLLVGDGGPFSLWYDTFRPP